MNKSALNYYDTYAYKNYLSNIEILRDTVEIHKGLVGNTVSIKIIDNNKKYFKKRCLSDEFLGPESTNELQRYLGQMVGDYIKGKIGCKIQNEINKTLINDWREENDRT